MVRRANPRGVAVSHANELLKIVALDDLASWVARVGGDDDAERQNLGRLLQLGNVELVVVLRLERGRDGQQALEHRQHLRVGRVLGDLVATVDIADDCMLASTLIDSEMLVPRTVEE